MVNRRPTNLRFAAYCLVVLVTVAVVFADGMNGELKFAEEPSPTPVEA